MIHVIVASHGPLAAAMRESAEMVYGALPHVFTVTLTGETGIEGFRQDFAHALNSASLGADGVLVLCDMQSGTPWNVACQYAFSPAVSPPVKVIGGVNLPMLLQTDDVLDFQDVDAAAAQLLDLTQPTLVVAAANTRAQSDDF
jgi:PTS system mannose-specific IIA component